jgi:phosphoserine phosphatase
MWDYLFVDSNDKPTTVLEMKTTKRVEDWKDDIPEYYAMQAALYAYLLDVDRVIMVCTVLEDRDYENPENFKVNASNTFTREFLVSERYPDMEKTIRKVKKWWKDHVVSGKSPVYDEKRDAEILKALRANTVNPETDVADLVREAEEIQTRLDAVAEQTAEDVKRLKVLKDQIKEIAQSQFREGDKEVIIPGSRYNWVTSVSVRAGFDEAKMKEDGVLDKYKTKETITYRLTNKAKED